MNNHYKLVNYSFKLLFVAIALMGISVIVIERADHAYAMKQLGGIFIGIIITVIVSLINYNRITNFAWLLYGINLFLLILVKIPGIGVEVNHARRWLDVGIQIQPSELSKIILIIFTAYYIEKNVDQFSTAKCLIKLCALVGLPMVLVLSQPNLSTTIITFLVFCCLVFLGGISKKFVTAVLGISIPTAFLGLWYIQQPGQVLLKGYQLQRILGFINPQKYSETFYQQENSLTAIGSGQLLGNSQSNFQFSISDIGSLPEAHTDFIFAIVGQELGFVGCSLVIVLLLLLVFFCFRIGTLAPNLSGMLICCGVGTLVAVQSFLNIAVATALMPNTGVPLPFISYGLTSLWSLLIGVGIVLNVGLQRHR